MADHFCEFPFEEIRMESGDYFNTAQDAMDCTGYDISHVWSVVESDGSYAYGPVGHVVNLLGYIATKEAHDGDTYYFEEADEDDEDEDWDNEEE